MNFHFLQNGNVRKCQSLISDIGTVIDAQPKAACGQISTVVNV
ncbi:hypothetical protein [Escherichia sp. E4702]|nr:hypothetical protein [Escherichia sp. E4702]